MINQLEKIRDGIDFDGSSTWRFAEGENIRVFSNNRGRTTGATIIVAFPEGEKDPSFEIVQNIQDHSDEWGIPDLDPISWEIYQGNSFHGITLPGHNNRDNLMALEILLNGIDIEKNPYSWVIVTLMDYAS